MTEQDILMLTSGLYAHMPTLHMGRDEGVLQSLA